MKMWPWVLLPCAHNCTNLCRWHHKQGWQMWCGKSIEYFLFFISEEWLNMAVPSCYFVPASLYRWHKQGRHMWQKYWLFSVLPYWRVTQQIQSKTWVFFKVFVCMCVCVCVSVGRTTKWNSWKYLHIFCFLANFHLGVSSPLSHY